MTATTSDTYYPSDDLSPEEIEKIKKIEEAAEKITTEEELFDSLEKILSSGDMK
jgi:hypothetical protein